MKKVVFAAFGAVGALVLGLLLVVAAVLGMTMSFEQPRSNLAKVPEEFRRWISKAAAACEHPEVSESLLAAQLKQESGFRTGQVMSPAGAGGPAQFLAGTYETYGRDEDGNGVSSRFDTGDAVMAQGRMMCSLVGQAKKSGYPGGPVKLALAGYNAGWGAVQQYSGVPPYAETQNYVKVITASQKDFETGGEDVQLVASGGGTNGAALKRAAGRLGTPYAYGGGTPGGPSRGFCDGANGYRDGRCLASQTVGFDCSSLTQYAYWPSLQLPRTAAAQYGATSDRPVSRDRLEPGDLMFWSRDGSQSGIYHVALYAGGDRVLHAPRTGRDVEIVDIADAIPAREYMGATRP
ncbi:NlpC/P60 family protein (plasmid) [Streptomyces sp. WAC00276]|uniref:C40 family peptidase n=1 Tax=Streptomyces sp. WAC00276 TaxID=2933778 RepID=UPI001FFECE60|nr:bifunctional lytic transglycosylase/C40 family peptidase [Streptomyces sp. WAC00276]MCK2145335.1 NlpC/P60 family protein [Streptomyces sp. WAC00276]